MTLESWLDYARADAARRGLDRLAPLLESLAASLRALRAADWNVAADDPRDTVPTIADAGTATAARPTPLGAPSEGSARAGESARARSDDGPLELRSITAVAPLVARGTVSSRDLVEACLARVTSLNPSLNALIAVVASDARRAAARADEERASGRLRGPLHGIPITLKDLIDVARLPTTAASGVRRGVVAARDATATRRLAAAGAVLIGKANLHEFAFGTTNEDSVFGPARHPADPSRSPGGSSGGSAVSIATGMCFASIGTDTGGSIRIPAAACGLVGLKPTFGEVPTQGVVPLAWSLDHVGPLARSVDDARLLLQVLRGDARDLRDNLPAPGAHDLRLRPLEQYFVELLEPGVREAYAVAIAALRDAGVQTTPAVIPHAPLTAAVYLPTVLAEAMGYHRPTLDRCPELYQPNVRIRLEMGRYVPGEDYVRAARGREVLTREVDAALQGADALVLPTLPIVAPRLGESTVSVGERREPVRNVTLRLTQLFDVTGHPAITLPIGDAEPGLPAGLQLVGHRGYTDRLLAVAKAVEGVLHSMLR